jgi:hypothetical protein
MFKHLIGIALFFFCLSTSAYAQLASNPLANTTWVFYAWDYDARPQYQQPAWHKGEITFHANYTADLRLTHASEDVDSTDNRISLKYNINSSGKIDIVSTNPQDPLPYIGGQLSKNNDKISAVIKINPSQDGIIMMLPKTLVAFSDLDIIGEWGGRVFANNGKDGIGWMVFDLMIDAKGNVKGTQTRFDGQKGSFKGTASISASGQIVIQAIDEQDAQYPVTISAQMSKERTAISFNFINPHDNGQGIGVMIKK